jgi:hypothetical protein
MINVLQYALYEGWNAVKAGDVRTVHRGNRGHIGNREMGYTEGDRGRYYTVQHRHRRVTAQDVVGPIYIRLQDGILRAMLTVHTITSISPFGAAIVSLFQVTCSEWRE